MQRLLAPALLLGLVLAPPASAKLVYERHTGHGNNRAILAARNDGTGEKRIGTGFGPYVSPNGRKVAYFKPSSAGADLYVVGVGGKHRRRVTRDVYDAGPAARLAWSADGRRLVFAATGATRGDAFLVDLREKTRRRIGRGDDFSGASFKPGGARFVVGEMTDRFSQLAIFRIDPFGRTPVTQGSTPTWGPPGIAFARVNPGTGPDRVLLRRPNGEVRTILEEQSSGLFPVDWSCDGRFLLIAESIEPGSPFQPILFDRSNGALTRVPAAMAQIWDLSKGGQLVLAESGGDVVSVTSTGVMTVLAEDADHPTWTK